MDGLGLGCLRGRAVTGAVCGGGGLAMLYVLLIGALTLELASFELQEGLTAAVGSPRIVSPQSSEEWLGMQASTPPTVEGQPDPRTDVGH